MAEIIGAKPVTALGAEPATIPFEPPKIDTNEVDTYGLMYAIAQGDTSPESVERNRQIIAMGNEVHMRRSLYTQTLERRTANNAEVLDSFLQEGNVEASAALIKGQNVPVPFDAVTEEAAALQAGAMRDADPLTAIYEVDKSDEDKIAEDTNYAFAMYINKKFMDYNKEIPDIGFDWIAQAAEYLVPLSYELRATEREGANPMRAVEAVATGFFNKKEQADIFWDKTKSIDEKIKAFDEWETRIKERLGYNPIMFQNAMEDIVFQGQHDNDELLRVMRVQQFLDGNPNVLTENYNAEGYNIAGIETPSWTELWQDPWINQTFTALDFVSLASFAKKLPRVLGRMVGNRVLAQAAAKNNVAATAANQGSQAIGYSFNIIRDNTQIIPSVRQYIDPLYDFAEQGIGNKVVTGYTNPTSAQIQKAIKTNLEDEFSSRLVAAEYKVDGPFAELEGLVGLPNGMAFANRQVAENASKTMRGEFEPVRNPNGSGWLLKTRRSVDQAAWFEGNDAEKLAASNRLFKKIPTLNELTANNNWFGKFFWSPAVTSIVRTTRGAVNAAQNRAVMSAVVDRVLKPISKLSGKESTQLGVIINKGKTLPSKADPTQKGRWFDYDELNDKYQTEYGRNVKEHEAVAYYAYKLASDINWSLMNENERASLMARGYNSYSIKNHAMTNVIAKQVVKRGQIEADAVLLLPDGSVKTRAQVSSTLINDKKFEILNVEGKLDHNGKEITHVIAKREDVSTGGLQRNVLGYTEGGTRNYKDVWFAKQRAVQMINGDPLPKANRTLGVFATHKEGKAYVDKMNLISKEYVKYLAAVKRLKPGGLTATQVRARFDNSIAAIDHKYNVNRVEQLVNSGELDVHNPLHIVYDRDNIPGDAGPNPDRLQTYQRKSGLYYSHRNDFLADEDNNLAELVSPYEALSRQMTHVIQQNAWKNFAIREVGEWGAAFATNYKVPGVKFPTVDEILKSGEWIGGNSPEAAKLRNMAESQRLYLNRMLAHPGDLDTKINVIRNTLAQKLARTLGDKNVPESFRTGKIANELQAIQALRTLAYNVTLGFLNFGQLIMQGSAALTATAIHPIHGALAIKDYFGIRAAMLFDSNPHVVDLLDKRMGALGYARGEFKEMIDDYRTSGFHIIGRTDISLDKATITNPAAKGINMLNATMEAMRLPLYEGERIGRIVAFGIARRQAQDAAAKGLFKVKSPEYFEYLRGETNKYTLGMTSGMETWWQRNTLASLPTQFFQYPFKYTEIFLGMNKQFTRAEQWKFILAHTFMWGAYAVPWGPQVSDKIMDEYVAATQEKLDKDTYDKIMLGLGNDIISSVFGEDMALSATLGAGDFVGSLIDDIYGDNTPIGLSGGLALDMLTKSFGALGDLHDIWSAVAFNEAAFDSLWVPTAESMAAIGNLVKSTSNANRAYLLHNYGIMIDGRGRPVEQTSEFSAFLTALGIRSTDEFHSWKAYESNKERMDRIQEMVDIVGKIRIKAEMEFRQTKNPSHFRDAYILTNGLYRGMKEEDRMILRKEVQRLYSRDMDYINRNNPDLPYNTGVD